MGVVFGTDGIRGLYGNSPITPTDFYAIGLSVANIVRERSQKKCILVAHDGRTSAITLQKALAEGLADQGLDVWLLGLLPTPALAKLAEQEQTFGCMITASHNPASDNGLKLFTDEGIKWDKKLQEALSEAAVKKPNTADSNGLIVNKQSWANSCYLDFLTKFAKQEGCALGGCKLVLDCANGATRSIAPMLFQALGATVSTIHTDSGEQINHHAGSTCPEQLQKAVIDSEADAGLAFDGDGDRVIAVDSKGRVLDGDHILYLLAATTPKLKKVVSTIMANQGLIAALQALDIDCQTSQVGDKHVHQLMLSQGLCLGAEPSGHVLYLPYSKSGDGILAGILCLTRAIQAKKTLSEWYDSYNKYPSKLVNLPYQQTEKNQEWLAIIDAIQKQYETVHILLRQSNTEPVWRLKVEAKTLEEVEWVSNKLTSDYHAILL